MAPRNRGAKGNGAEARSLPGPGGEAPASQCPVGFLAASSRTASRLSATLCAKS